jgi:ubiquitin C-terminal hydrolase
MSRKSSFIGAKVKERWWRISDEEVTECAVEDILDQQEEAYLLFYEREM